RQCAEHEPAPAAQPTQEWSVLRKCAPVNSNAATASSPGNPSTSLIATCGLDPMNIGGSTRITLGEESSATCFFQVGLAIPHHQRRVSQSIALVLAESRDAPCWRTARQNRRDN